MPTYSYQCSACNHAFEQVQRMSDDPTKVCPSCGAEAVRRLINSANFILKGSGWYADAYSGGSNKKSGGDSKPASSSSTSTATPAASSSDSGSSSSGGDGGSSSSATPAAPPPSAPSTTTKT